MNRVHISAKWIPLVKSSLSLRKKIIYLKLTHYRMRLRAFEKKYRMTTAHFLRAFGGGNLDDSQDFVEWEFLSESYRHLSREFKDLNCLKL